MSSLDDALARDKELVLRAQQDVEAFGAIFDEYYSRIFSYALRRTGEVEVAEDITAETFAKAMRAIRKFTWRGIPLSAWLYRIAGNELKQLSRGKQKRTISLEALCENGFDPAAEASLDERAAIEAVLAEDALYARVVAVLWSLPPRYSEVLALRYMEHKEIWEIAEIFSVREGTVRSLLSRGLDKLRAALEPSVQQKAGESITTNEGRSVLSVLTRNIS